MCFAENFIGFARYPYTYLFFTHGSSYRWHAAFGVHRCFEYALQISIEHGNRTLASGLHAHFFVS
jgi:hypothetical protein